MKEREIREKAIAELAKMGYKWLWWPTRPRFTAREWDILGIYDIMAARKKNDIIYVQYTTKPNINARIKKIQGKFDEYHASIKNSWVWGWDKKAKVFVKIRIEHGGQRITAGQSGRSGSIKPRSARRVQEAA